MAERTASDVSVQLESFSLSPSTVCSLFLRLGTVYEKSNKLDLALNAYMKCVESDLDNPLPLYRFVSISRNHRPTMAGLCLKLLGTHFLAFLSEYESTRQIAINEMMILREKEILDRKKESQVKKAQLSSSLAIYDLDSPFSSFSSFSFFCICLSKIK